MTVMRTEVSGSVDRAGALEELYVRNAPAAMRLAYFLTGDRDQAEDLVQEAFVRVAGRFQHRRVPENVHAYLRRTIVNLFTSQIRRRRLERRWLHRQAVELTTTGPEDNTLREDLWRALEVLSQRQRAAIVLRYYEDLSEREAAGVLGCSLGALNQLVVRATATLRTHVRRDQA